MLVTLMHLPFMQETWTGIEESRERERERERATQKEAVVLGRHRENWIISDAHANFEHKIQARGEREEEEKREEEKLKASLDNQMY